MLKDHRSVKEIASRDDGIGSKKLLYAAFALPVTLKEYLPINVFYLALSLVLLVEFGKLGVITLEMGLVLVRGIALGGGAPQGSEKPAGRYGEQKEASHRALSGIT